jgi:hypothetical protein
MQHLDDHTVRLLRRRNKASGSILPPRDILLALPTTIGPEHYGNAGTTSTYSGQYACSEAAMHRF